MANRNVARAVRVALIAATAASSGVYASGALAQDAELEQIVVTGSRIANPNLDSASQVLAVGSDEIQLQQVSSAEALLRDLPAVVPSIGPGVNNGNNGAQTLNLRGLGTNRNLVLLDSRRIVPFGLTGVTDLQTIPLAMIERVDIVTGGASSVYGADAITGVANFITKKNFEGVQIDSNYRITEKGDGSIFSTELTVGGNLADGRGNAVLSIGYSDADEVLQGDRSFSRFNVSSVTGNPGGSSASAPTVVAGVPGLGTRQINPVTGALDPGFTPYNFNPLNIFQTPVERFNIFGQADFDVTDSVEVYGSALFTNSEVVSQIAPSATFFNTYALPISNPFLPVLARNQICTGFGISPAECAAAAVATNPSDPAYREVNLGLRRRFVEAGPRTTTFENDAFQIMGGIRGDLPGDWTWDLGAQYGESNQVSTIGQYGLFSRAQQALRAVSTTECQDPTNGCVPLNLFGPVGSLTNEMFNFLDAGSSTRTDTDLTAINLTFTGDLGDTIKSPLAKEPIGLAIGSEYREYGASQAGDFLGSQPGELLGAGGADPAVSGSYNVVEGYLEMIAPLLSDMFLADSLTLEAGVRFSDYSTTGNATTWKAGLTWGVTEDIKVRGMYQSATRSPNISELFFPVQTVLDNFATDPCAGAAPASNPALAAICQAQGAPASVIGNIDDPAAGQVNITTGGNRDLDTEEADTFTVGIVWQPSMLENLQLTLDYFQIEVDGAITSPEVGDVIDGCFDPAFNPSLTFNAACAGIFRNTNDGSLNGSPADVKGVVLQLSNLGAIETSGVDFGVSYLYDFGDIGRLNWSLNGTYTIENKFQATPVSENRDCVGFYSTNCGNIQPEITLSQRFTWSWQQLDFSVRHRYIDGVEIEPALKGTFLPKFESIDSYNYFDLSVRAGLTDNVTLVGTIENLLDEEPPVVGADVGPTAWNSGNTYPTVYDALGRTFSLGVSLKF